MLNNSPQTIRILVADDEPTILQSYRIILTGGNQAAGSSLNDLKSKLFGNKEDKLDNAAKKPEEKYDFDVVYVSDAHAAVDSVRESCERNEPFAVIFLDMRMPPGPGGDWAAEQIRALDSQIDIVLSTAYSDIDPQELSANVPPAGKMFYLQKPFHPHEVRQLASALGQKWLAEKKILRLAYYDTLTELPNRALFMSHIEQAMKSAKRYNRPLAVLFLDLDNFKYINDTFGHDVGDEVLQAAAQQISHSLRNCDMIARPSEEEKPHHIARLGGDEFTVLLTDLQDSKDAFGVAERIREEFSSPLQLKKHTIAITPSIGISLYPNDGQDVGTLMKNADIAMYHAKRKGRNDVRFFNATLNEKTFLRKGMENEMYVALERNEFSLVYQPQVDVGTGVITGMEAFLRWNSPALGNVPPLECIPVAEECNLITPIGSWVLRTACRQAKTWLKANLQPKRVSVNISPLQLTQKNFLDEITELLQATGLPAHALELEITESDRLNDASMVRTLETLKEIGIGLAIDNFGTGCSSLSHIQQLPVDCIKVGPSFVKSITTSSVDQAIVRAVVSIAQSRNLRVTATGIETKEQMQFIEKIGCNVVQGFYFCKPLQAEDAQAFVRKQP